MSKRGQSRNKAASGAAVLVLLIATVLVLYILFLPPDERAELLGESSGSGSGSGSGGYGSSLVDYNETLFVENIGRLDHLKFDYREYELPSFRVYSETEVSTLKTVNSIYVKNSIGNEESYNMSFKIVKRMTSDVQLAFNVKDASGRLSIYLNEKQIFNGELREGSPQPIKLPDDILENDNKLSFKVSKVGLAFWRTNKYSLENIMITGNILDDSHSSSRQFFYVSEVEQQNLESIKLKFYPGCTVREVGPLLIYLNGDEIFSGVADCGVYNSLYMNIFDIREGENELEFIATEGSYLIDRVSVRTELEELIYPVYYFDLDEEIFFYEDAADCEDDCQDDCKVDCFDDCSYTCNNNYCADQCADDCKNDCNSNDGACLEDCMDDCIYDECSSDTCYGPCYGECYYNCDNDCEIDCEGYDDTELELKSYFDVKIKFRFVNDDDNRLEFLINGHRRHIDVDELTYEANINDYIVAGTNSIEIIPKTVVDITELKVTVSDN